MASRRFEIIGLPSGIQLEVMVEHNNPDFVCAACGAPGSWDRAFRSSLGRALPIHEGRCALAMALCDDSQVRYA